MDIQNPHLDPSNIDIEAATRWSRLAARLLDYVLWFAPLAFILFPCLGPILALLGWLALLIVQIWMLVTRAQTLGKKALDIYIMRADGNIPHVGWLLMREFVIPVIAGVLQAGGAMNHNPMGEALILLGALLWLIDVLFIFGPTRRCLHDRMAGTHVVKAV